MADMPPRHALAPGTAVGARYRVERWFAQGGMSDLYLVAHKHTGGVYVLKVLKPDAALDPKMREGFRRGYRAAGRISRNQYGGDPFEFLVRETDAGEDGEMVYLVMEKLDGVDLEVHLEKNLRLSVEEAVDIICQVACGLFIIHECGVVHRDLKPGNVMLVPTGARGVKPKILDFGIARSTDNDTDPGTGLILGTVDYMAPEQLLDRPVDARADQYALGAILFRCLAGRAHVEGNTVEKAMQITQGRIMAAKASCPGVPEALGALVDRARSREPERRYHTISEMARCLVEFASPAVSSKVADYMGFTQPSPFAHSIEEDPAARVENNDPTRPTEIVKTSQDHAAGTQEVTVTVRGSPADLCLRDPETGRILRRGLGAIRLAKSGRIRAVVAEAEGHKPQRLELAADRDQVVAVSLVPATVTVDVCGSPSSLRVVDSMTGEVLLRGPGSLRLRESGTSRTLVVEAPRYLARRIDIVPDRDMAIEVALDPIRRGAIVAACVAVAGALALLAGATWAYHQYCPEGQCLLSDPQRPSPDGGVLRRAPSVTGITPKKVLAGSHGLTLRLQGPSFAQGARVMLDGEVLHTTVSSTTVLTASIPAERLEEPKRFQIWVVEPGPNPAQSEPVELEVVNPAPKLTSLEPGRMPTRSNEARIVLDGEGFVVGSQVFLDGNEIEAKLVGDHLEATIPSGELEHAGQRNIWIVNGAPGGGKSESASLSIEGSSSALSGAPSSQSVCNYSYCSKEPYHVDKCSSKKLVVRCSGRTFMEFKGKWHSITIVGNGNSAIRIDAVKNIIFKGTQNDVTVLAGNPKVTNPAGNTVTVD